MQTYNLDIDELIPDPLRQLHLILYKVALTEREFAVLKNNVQDIPDEIRCCAEQSGIQQ